MFTASTRKARSRSRRNAARWISKEAAPALTDDLPEAPDDAEFSGDDVFVLGADDVFTTFAGNTTPPQDQPTAPPVITPAASLAADDDDIPFDAPEEDDEIFQQRRIIETEADEGELLLTTPAAGPKPETDDAAAPLPAISIYASWDSSEIAETLFAKLAADPRTRRAALETGNGGIDGAAAHLESGATPDLLLLHSTLTNRDMLRALDRLAPAVARGAKIVLLGAVNDIGLLRELAARGVNEYVVPPIAPAEFVNLLCRLYADLDPARAFAVIGARGGIGASTIAQNLAWSIAERQQQSAALVDLDLPFGAAALSLRQQTKRSIGEAFAIDAPTDALFDEVAIQHTPRLKVFAAPANLEADSKIDGEALTHVLRKVRRTSGHIVLDIPHVWSAWTQQTLLAADDIIIVAGPDLASLSSAKNMLEALREARPSIAPHIVLSMVGVPKRPEIALKEFASALGADPSLILPFDPALFGEAAMAGKMLGEIAPESKTTLALDQLATLLTGHDTVAQPAKAPAPQASMEQAQPAAPAIEDDSSVQGALKRLKSSRKETPHAFITRARDAVPTRKSPKRQAPTSNLLRAATALTALVVASAWLIEYQRPSAAAAALPPASAAPAPAPTPAPPPPNPAAEFEAAMQRLNSGDVTLLQALAERDYAPAQYRLAKLYEEGQGVEIDLAAALRWTERAAQAGEARAMHDLGVYYARGEATPVDPVAAFRWFRAAAELGVADSQYNLGVLYEQGRGVSADPAEALFWFTIAARQGDTAAAERAANIAPRLSMMAADQARARAEAFAPRRA